MQKKTLRIGIMALGALLLLSGCGRKEGEVCRGTGQKTPERFWMFENDMEEWSKASQKALGEIPGIPGEQEGVNDRKNEEFFYKAAGQLGLSEEEAAECLRILYEDDVFQGGEGALTAFLAGDFDGNGQRDMAARVLQDSRYILGPGCVYIYMNGDEPYCFVDDGFPFYSSSFNGMHISGGDLDNDGSIELLMEASGTGNGGAGDWVGRILKYKDHRLEKTDMFPEDEFDIEIHVIQEVEENSYSAFFPAGNETIAFQANEVFPGAGEPRWVGSNVWGLYDMHCVEYQGGYAVEARECLCGEGGNIHVVADAVFILVWDGGDWRVDQWWVET